MSRRTGRMSRGKNRGAFKFSDGGSTMRKLGNSDLIDIAGTLAAPFETEKAWRFYDGKITVWLPKSQCEWDSIENTMTMPEWLAKEKELI